MLYVNNNGDTPETLLANAKAAYRAINATLDAMVGPHGRNYADNASYQLARDDYDKRVEALCDMRDFYTNEAKHIYKSLVK